MSELKVVGVTKASNKGELYRTLLASHQFNLLADEQVSAGGNNEGPSPFDFICISLAACKTITLRMYVQRKKWDVDEINVKVNLIKADVGEYFPHDTFMCEVSVSGDISIEQKERLHQIEKACPISKLLNKGAEVVKCYEINFFI